MARAPFGVWGAEYLGHPGPFPLPLPAWFAPLTAAFNQVSARMHRRRLLPEGALWYDRDDRPSAWFAFAAGCRDPEVQPTVWTALVGDGCICAAS